MKRMHTVFYFFILILIVTGCEKKKVELSMNAIVDENKQSVEQTGIVSLLKKLDEISIIDALDEDWGVLIDILPLEVNPNAYLGGIVKINGKWIAGYESGFATMRLLRIEKIRHDMIRFTIDIWENADPEYPFAERSPEIPVYTFYVDLTEKDFKAAIRTGLLENKQIVVIPVNAYDLQGNRVDRWFDQLSLQKE